MDVGFLVFGLAGLLTLVCFMPPLAGRLKLPYSVLLAIVGCLLGIIVHVHGWAPSWIGDFLDSLERFEISSETFLMVFLPVLLFETALSMNVRRLMDDIGPILMMAIVAVVVCTVVVGVTLDAISPYGLVVCQAPDHAGGRRKPVQRRRVHCLVLGAAGRAGRARRADRQRHLQ